MALLENLKQRSNDACELCLNSGDLAGFSVYPYSDETADHNVLVCITCKTQINDPSAIEVNHWRCLNESIWSEFTPVKIVSWRVLDRLKNSGETWAQDLQDMMYLEDEELQWAQDGGGASTRIIHRDSNGVVLEPGDSVVLVKDLNVKGAGFTAKRGTAVRNIRLDSENENHIEGRVNGQMIVILTQFVKK